MNNLLCILLFIGTTEIILIVFAIFLLFGPKKIPEIARTLGKGVKDFKNAFDELNEQITNETESITDDKKTTNNISTTDKPQNTSDVELKG